MSKQEYGPWREIVIECPVHQACIGDRLEEAQERVLRSDVCRCLCARCMPNLITVAAWHLYWGIL